MPPTTNLGLDHRILEAYAAGAEAWKRDHEEAMKCWDLEELVTVGNWLFRILTRAENEFYADSRSGRMPLEPAHKQTLLVAYRIWLAGSIQLLSRVEEFEAKDYQFKGADDLRSHRQEVERILDQQESLGGRIRPVTIDGEGRAFLENGEQVLVPGLEPEKVRKGLAEDATGLGRPLREIIAERRRSEGAA
jgi:hypothetical protein